MPTLRECQAEIAVRMRRGDTFASVEERLIDPSSFSEREKAALWLFGWSFVDWRRQRREAARHIESLAVDGGAAGVAWPAGWLAELNHRADRTPSPMATTPGPLAGWWPPIDEAFPAVSDSVAQARGSVSRWLRALDADALMSTDIALAVSEACTNVVQHGYRDGDSGAFRIRAGSLEGGVCVIVSDDGRGMLSGPAKPGLGLGLPLMAVLTDRLEIGAGEDGAGTVVCMHFTAAGADAR